MVLPLKTLQGYLGEVFGGLIAITQKPFDLDWEIPVHLFSFHDTVFDWLDMYLQNAEISTDIPGRTGDDNLAFLRNKNNEIIAVLFIEAKCTLTHNVTLINDAHSKLSKSNIIPVSRDKIKLLLIEKGDSEQKHHDNEKTFASMRVYLIHEHERDKHYDIYAWVLEEKYYLEDDEIKRDSGSSIPYKFVVKNIDDKFTVTDSRIPRDGSYYAVDMKNIFPDSVRNDMEEVHTDGTIERLELDIEQQTKLYFHK